MESWGNRWFGRPGGARERVLIGIGLAILVGMLIEAALSVGAMLGP